MKFWKFDDFSKMSPDERQSIFVWKKNDKKCEILDDLKNDPKSIFASKINDFRGKSEVFQTNSSRSRASVGGARAE